MNTCIVSYTNIQKNADLKKIATTTECETEKINSSTENVEHDRKWIQKINQSIFDHIPGRKLFKRWLKADLDDRGNCLSGRRFG